MSIVQLRANLRAELKKQLATVGQYDSVSLTTAAAELDQTVFMAASAAHKVAPKIALTDHFLERADKLTSLVSAQIGSFPDEIAGKQFLDKEISKEDMLSHLLYTQANPDARETGRRLFVRALVLAAPELGPAKHLEMAAAIEVSCYNAAVRISKESTDPPRRAWDSPAFVDIYSMRCGAVYSALDPNSTSCINYGAQLLSRILSGELPIARLGDMSEREMCPPATAAERADIKKRSEQKVDHKTTNIFECPHCKARQCTYEEVQLRSADEAPDYFCFCLACNRKFKGKQ